VKKDELLKLLQDDEVKLAIFNILRAGVPKGKTPITVDAKSEKEPEKKANSVSHDMLKNLRARVEKAAAEKEKAKLKAEQEEAAKKEAENKADEGSSLSFDPMDALSQEATRDEIKADINSKLALLRNRVKQEKESEQEEAKTETNSQEPAKKKESDYRLILERPCPVCENNTRIIKYKSTLPVSKRDLDFCIQYNGINPYLYTALSCEHCGYTAEEKKFLTKLPNKYREKLAEFLSDGSMVMKFNENRSLEEAVSLTEMAILFCEMTDNSPSRKANLVMRIAWMYRYAKDKEKENEYLKKAIPLYEEALRNERAYAGNLTGNMVVYLLGAINFLIGDYDASTTQLSRIISDKNVRVTEARIYDLAKDLWQDIRVLKKSGGKGK